MYHHLVLEKCLKVDINYPKSLHDKHNDYPFLPEQLNDKLIPNLCNKKVVY